MARTADQLGDDLGVEHGAALAHAVHTGGKFGEVGDTLLQEVSDSIGPGGQQLDGVASVYVLREYEYADGRPFLPYGFRGPQPLVGVRRWHADVDDHYFGLGARHELQELVRVPGHADYLEPRLL